MARQTYRKEGRQESRERKCSNSNNQISLNPKMPLSPSYDLKASISQERKIKKSNFLQQLECKLIFS